MKHLTLIVVALLTFCSILYIDNISINETINIGNKMANGVYWVGNDGNYWTKTSSGVNNLGYAGTSNPNLTVINGLSRIDNPSGTQNYQVGTDSAAPYSGGGGGDTQQTYTDPYAQWGGQAAYNNLVSGFNNQKSNIYGTANDAAAGLEGGYRLSVADTLRSLTQGQQAIDRKNVNNESSKMQGAQGVMGMVSRGIKSGGVMLANRNAGNSSAASAIANAYGDQGRRQMSTIGNQYAKNQGDIALDQGNQDYAVQMAPQRFHEQLMQNVNDIVTSARNQLGALDAAMASANLPGRIAIEQEKEAIKSQVLGRLQQYDSQIQTGVGGIKATGREQNMTTAQDQMRAGTADPNLFQFSDQAPGGFNQSGPAASNLPLFTLNKRRLTS